MKKIVISITIILLATLVGAYCYFSNREYEFRFSESQLHAKMSEKLPLTKKYLFIKVRLDNPRINLVNGSDRVAAGLDVTLDLTINKKAKTLEGSVDATGGVKYLAESGEFFLTDPVIEDLSIQGIPDKYTEKANQVLSKALAKYYEDHPIYTLRPTDVKHAAARLVLKNVIIEDKQLVVTIGI